jgi:hypothetical protein
MIFQIQKLRHKICCEKYLHTINTLSPAGGACEKS